MTISNDLLLGLIVGVILVLLFQQGMKLSNRLMSPGCLIPIALAVVLFIVFVAAGIIDFQPLG
jgi:hypothetical protein